MTKLTGLSAVVGLALLAMPLSAYAAIYQGAVGTPVYAAPQGYTTYYGGTSYQPQNYYGQNYYQPSYYTQPQQYYTQQPAQYYYGPNVTVQPINYQPFTQYNTGYGQQQQQQQYSYQPQSYATNGYYTQPSYGYSTGIYAGYYGANNPPIDTGYYTGDHDTFGGAICYFPDYGRADCGSNPRQPVYDAWTGTWY